MEIPFTGGSYQLDAKSFAVQRSINLFPILPEVPNTKSAQSLRGCAGTVLHTTAGTGGIRGAISSTSGRAFVVSGNTFYEINTDATVTSRGTLNTQTTRVSIAENNTQIMIVDGTDGWIFTLATNAFTQIVDADFPTCSFVDFQDGYFLVIEDGTQKFWISNASDGTAWTATDFTSVESSPDNLTGLAAYNGNVWLFGNRSAEVYQDTGNATFPFERIGGAIIPTGCANGFTISKFDNGITWLGIDEQGKGVVWRSEGYQAKRVSTHAIESRIATATTFVGSYSWVYHEKGHIFYCLQIAGLDTTLVFDGSTGLWHERMFKDTATNTREQHRGSCHFFFNNKSLIGDRETGKIFELSTDYYDDNGEAQIRERISPHLQAEKKLLTHSSFELDMEVGTGLVTGQGSDPQIMLQYSDDGGNTYSNEIWRDIGKIGKYNTRVQWRQLGSSRDRVYKVRVSDPVFVQINAAYLNGT